jgi:hypothetical protein
MRAKRTPKAVATFSPFLSALHISNNVSNNVDLTIAFAPLMTGLMVALIVIVDGFAVYVWGCYVFNAPPGQCANGETPSAECPFHCPRQYFALRVLSLGTGGRRGSRTLSRHR